VARCLLIAAGCRGLDLTRALRERGHAVRATTRNPARAQEIRAAGAEPFIGDPDRVATLAPAFAHVGVTCVLLGSATGTPEALAALHSTRLDMLMEKMIDTTSRGVVYEAVGSVGEQVLAAGAERVRWWCDRSLIPYALLEASTDDRPAWTAAAADAVDGVLLSRVQRPG
jgi:putative NADH-flavin reductase